VRLVGIILFSLPVGEGTYMNDLELANHVTETLTAVMSMVKAVTKNVDGLSRVIKMQDEIQKMQLAAIENLKARIEVLEKGASNEHTGSAVSH
jgi:hypothetical protein